MTDNIVFFVIGLPVFGGGSSPPIIVVIYQRMLAGFMVSQASVRQAILPSGYSMSGV